MVECTLKEYVAKVGDNVSESARRLGVKRQMLDQALKNNTSIIVLHDANLNVLRAQLVRDWGNANG